MNNYDKLRITIINFDKLSNCVEMSSHARNPRHMNPQATKKRKVRGTLRPLQLGTAMPGRSQPPREELHQAAPRPSNDKKCGSNNNKPPIWE